MRIVILLPSGKQIQVQGDFRGFRSDVQAPMIELDKLDEHGQREVLLPDPRAYIVSATMPDLFERGASEAEIKNAPRDTVLYNPRDDINRLAPEMRQWMIEHPDWPKLPREGLTASVDLPKAEWGSRPGQFMLLIVYEGDITEKLRASGTKAQFNLNDDGDTEQHIQVDRGKASSHMSADEFMRFTEKDILEEAAKNGRVKSHRWFTSLTEPVESMTAPEGANLDETIDWLLQDFEARQNPVYWREHYNELARDIAHLVKRRLWRHALITDVYKRLNARIRNTRPEHAIGTKLWAEFTCAETILNEDGKHTCLDGDQVLENESALDVLVAVRESEVYLWTEKTEQLARGAPLPKHTISPSVMPQRAMFWAREMPHGSDERISNWFVLTREDDRIAVAHDQMSGDGTIVEVMTFGIEYGKVWPNEFEAAETVGTILKWCAFLNSPFVTSAKQKLPRHIRRQLERQNQDVPDDDVSIVILRRALVRKPQMPSGEHPGVEWKHHWWVGDHYRAQWYPSEQAHRVIWIAPFIKGDLSKPLLEKIYKVQR